jgi:hypothetical protein
MKGLSLSFLLIACTLSVAFGQSKNIPPIDKSGMDMSYFPVNYPILKIQDKAKDPLYVRVIYSRPQKNGREVFGGLVEYGQIWRVGANEATEIEFFRDVTVGKSKIKKGRYTLYVIPQLDNWTVIFNRDTDTWGAFKYDQKKDAGRVDVKPEKNVETAEAFSMYFEPRTGGANLYIHWDNVRAAIPIGF